MFAEDGRSILDCYDLSNCDPAVIHGRLSLGNQVAVPAYVGPRSLAGIFVPLLQLYDLLDFVLLRRSTTGSDERGGDCLKYS